MIESKEQSWNFNELIGFKKNQLLCLHRWKVRHILVFLTNTNYTYIVCIALGMVDDPSPHT